jgi:hypothetical protein
VRRKIEIDGRTWTLNAMAQDLTSQQFCAGIVYMGNDRKLLHSLSALLGESFRNKQDLSMCYDDANSCLDAAETFLWS